MFFLFICLGSEEYLTSHGRAAENMTKMIKKITFSVHIITGNSRGVWGLRRAKRLGGHRFVTLARLVSQSATEFSYLKRSLEVLT